MSTSAIKKHNTKTSLIYLAAAAFCGIFAIIYYQFSHGVSSDYLVFMFMIPLLFGSLIYISLNILFKGKRYSRIAYNIYNTGTAALTIGMMLQGIMEIAGTSSNYVIVFFILGPVLITSGTIVYLIPSNEQT